MAILPTKYQADSFPKKYESKIHILHEGAKKEVFHSQRIKNLKLGENIVLDEETEVVTYISRNLEPMRGFHNLMRAIPTLQSKNQKVNIVIVGGDNVSYSNEAPDGKTWKETLLAEIQDHVDTKRIHFINRLEHSELMKLYEMTYTYIIECVCLKLDLTK